MIKATESNSTFDIRTKTTNTLMISGKKKTGEKILLKFTKLQHKFTTKNIKDVLQLAIVNSTPTFKLNKQVSKKSKEKSTRNIPLFVKNNSIRIMASLTLIRNSVLENRDLTFFYESLAIEIMALSQLKGQTINKKDNLQKEILTNKKYLSKFRW